MAAKGLIDFIFEQGSKPENLMRLGLLTPESLANPIALKTAQTKYKKSLQNPAVAAREEGRLTNPPVINQGLLPEKKIIRPEDIENTILVSHKGDTSSTDTKLLELGGVKFDNPPESRGGVRFGDSPKTPEELYWASMATGAVPLQNKAEGLMAALDMPVTGVYGAMGDEALFFNDAFSDTMLQSAQKLPIPKKSIEVFDADMRKIKDDWVGINHPDARDQLLGLNGYPREGAGGFRSAFASRMSMAKYRDLGFPAIEDVKSVFREPGLENTNLGDSGYVMGRIGQGYGLTKNTNHLSYDTGIMGDVLGGFEQSLPNRIAYPDAYRMLESEMTKPKDPSKSAPRLFIESEKVDAIGKRKDLFQIADARWVDTASKWLEDNKGASNAALIAAVGLPAAMATQEADASIAKLADRGMKLIDVVDPEDSRVGQYYLQKGDDTKSIGSVNTDYALDSGFGEGYMSSQNTEIAPEYRRQGIGREVYDAIEELSGNQLVPSTHLSPQGAAMWNSRDRGLLEQVQDRMGKDNYDTVEDVLYPEGRPDPNAVKLRGFDRAYELGGIGLGGGLLAADSSPNFAIEGRNIRAEEDARRDQLQQILSRSQESPITDLAMKFVESAVMEPASYAAGIINPDFREPVRDSVNYDMGSTAQSMADKAGSNVGTAFEKYIMPTLINKIVPAVVDAYNKDSLLGGSAKDQVEYAQSLYGELPSEARRFASREIKPRAQNLMGLIGSIL
tara:strand:- start:1917 stop:4112 length:2196 start_codon:yes stop_codon:yes gene_type:complete